MELDLSGRGRLQVAGREVPLAGSGRAVVLEGGVLALEEGRRWRVREAAEAFLAGVWTEWAVGRREI